MTSELRLLVLLLVVVFNLLTRVVWWSIVGSDWAYRGYRLFRTMWHYRNMGAQWSFAALTWYRGTSGICALLHYIGAIMMICIVNSLPICILQFIHAVSTSLLIILFPILIYWLSSLDFPVIIAVHSWVDLLLRVEITTLLPVDTWRNNFRILSMSTRSGSITTIVVQNQVFVKLKVVDMNLLLKQFTLLLNSFVRRHNLTISKFYISCTLRWFYFIFNGDCIWFKLIINSIFNWVTGIDIWLLIGVNLLLDYHPVSLLLMTWIWSVLIC